MSRKFASINPEDSLKTVIDLFSNQNAVCLPVISGVELVGVITLKEIFKYLSGGHSQDVPVTRFIDKNPLLVQEDSIIDPVIKFFNNLIIVINQKNEVVGLIGQEELIRYFNNQLAKNRALVKELNAIIDSSYDGIYIADARGNTVRINKAYERITGFKETDLIGENLRTLVKKGYFSSSTTLKVMESKKTVTIVQRLKNGKKILCTGNPIFNEDARLDKVITNVRDITELEELKKQLDRAEELKDRYLSKAIRLQQKQLQLDDIIAESETMQKILDQCIKVAEFDSSVLILGESGVGKEVVAKIIHKSSKRRDGPFMKINCGAIPENLLESELFGYEGGAFTGANKNGKPGLFELSGGGTLLLDEIGELPFQLQVSLLRVIQEREFIRIGGTRPVNTNVRLLFATNKNLEELVERGQFREDLFYRINVIPIIIPPLRERIADIMPLTEYFLNKIQHRYGVKKKISEEAMEMLLRNNWPGNVRELENVIERITVLTQDYIIRPEHLPDNIRVSLRGKSVAPAPGRRSNMVITDIIPLKDAVEALENQLIQQALAIYGSTRKAANVLKISQASIVRKTKKIKNNK
ncbi:MAG: sigma 54-interacting transcriptional regulator [Firmicutes bacterium]|nr:sigma 54-interacting transcriptional regulator [Bacillota bacterium]